ncbi:ribonuclease H-like domain-containing protein [Tanacetum coccineum]
MEKTMKRYGVNHPSPTSYHPQTSGQVENTNRALKRILEKTVKDNPVIWSRKLDDAMWAFRTTYKTPTGTKPYKLIYGKNCHLPFEIEHRAYWALKNYNPDLINAGEKRMFQLHKIMNTTQAQQKALDDALVALANRLEFRKCNMRLKTDIKPKEATFQAIVSIHKSSIRFTINKKKFSLDVDMFKEILLICPKIPGQKFEDLPLKQDILSFIRDLGHTRHITYLTDVNVDYLHQPWRAFATVINMCLSGKETGMDKIRLSRAKIIWGMFYKKKIDYVYLLWEDFLFQIEYKYDKKTNKRFTKIIIDYFMPKDQSISRRNKMFWHTAQDDTMFTSMRCISRHEDTQVYGTILPKELTNQAMLESNAYKTYYAFASGEKTPKPKYVRKKADSDTSPKQKPVQATKCTRLKSKAKVAKPDKKKQPAKKIKAKGLAVLSEVELTEAKQLKLATKRSKTQFHSSYASGSGVGVDTLSKVPDEQQQKSSGTDERTGIIPGVPDVPIYKYESEKESWGNSDDEDKDDENDSDDLMKMMEWRVMHHDDDQQNMKKKNLMMNSMNKKKKKTLMIKKRSSEQQKFSQELGFEKVEEDAHVTLTLVLDTQKADEPVQSSSVSSNFSSKILNLQNLSPADNEIASLMETSARHTMTVPENTSSFNTTIPSPPPSLNPLL